MSIHYTKRFALIYRSEKKKIIRSNIDICKYILNILHSLKKDPNQDFKALYLTKTELESNGKYKEWVVDYKEEFSFFRRRLLLKDYLRDLFELTNNH